MVQKKFFIGKTREEIIAEAKKEAFSPKLIEDKASFIYEEHAHKETKLLVCLEGSMQIRIDGAPVLFEPYDKVIIPSGTPHSAIVGPMGCTYFWSEK